MIISLFSRNLDNMMYSYSFPGVALSIYIIIIIVIIVNIPIWVSCSDATKSNMTTDLKLHVYNVNYKLV